MKYFLFLFLAASLAALRPTDETMLTGKVTDEKGEALLGAAVKVFKGPEVVRGQTTDADGRFRIALDPGAYDVEVSFVGYTTARTTGVIVLAGQTNSIDFSLAEGTVLQETVIVAYKVPLIQQEKTSSGMTLTSESIRSAPGRDRAKAAAPAAGKAAAKPAPPRPADGPRLTYKEEGEAAPDSDLLVTGKKRKADADLDDRRESPATSAQPDPRAGLLTAGEWNDLHNWNKHWVDLLADGEIDEYQKMYGFYPQNRYAVLLQNEEGFPVVDMEIQLVSVNGRTLWTARTDNLGRAELWDGLFGEKTASPVLLAKVDGQSYKFPAARPFSRGLNQLKIKRECQAPKNVDIVWAVDATGSMGDEIEYLKTELLDVIGRVKGANPDLAVRMGSVFYRDQGDAYLVKSSGLSPDIRQTVEYIREQYADGGGDYPEAVHSALEEAIYRQPWSSDAVARICFLVLDASPHQNPEVLESLHKSIAEAARRGIRIVPVSASGIQKDTEFLMKFFGLATNGSYIFLTDHSGIGGKHIEPTTDEYKVELLNDLLVRVITEYATVQSCEGKMPILFGEPQASVEPQAPQNQQQQNPQNNAPSWRAFYYPNPAAQQFTLDLPFAVQSVTLYDAEGKAVRKLEKPREGANLVTVSDLAEGFYTIRILKDGRMQSGKLMVVRS